MTRPNSTTLVRVMVVDDSTVLRGLLRQIIDADPDMQVVASARNGERALIELDKQEIDVVLLDVEMPVMDGMTALPLIRKKSPNSVVIMSSSVTLAGAEITLRALELGAHDFIPKASTGRASATVDAMASELISKIRVHQGLPPAPPPGTIAVPSAKQPTPTVVSSDGPPPKLRSSRSLFRPRVIAIGSSTGGPNALEEVIRALPDALHLPITVTQHMPAMFTTILARRLEAASHRRCVEAQEDAPLEDNHIYVAPGDHHMVVKNSKGQPVLSLNQDPPENYCRPSVDVTFRSLASVYGGDVLAVILTGMGEDGRIGTQSLVDRGARLIAQNQESSVVWGMPGAVVNAGLASEVLSISEIGAAIGRLAGCTVRS